MTRVLFVCLGNICRSPTAEAVFRHQVQQAGLEAQIMIDSCGTGGWHVGKAPDTRATRAALARGIDMRMLRARQFQQQDMEKFDYLLAMDTTNLSVLQQAQAQAAASSAQVGLFLDYAPDMAVTEVPDPYYGGEQGFEHVLDLIEAASHGLLNHIRARLTE